MDTPISEAARHRRALRPHHGPAAIALALGALVLLGVLALLAGPRWISPSALARVWDPASRSTGDALLLGLFRAPRVIAAILVGALLAISGGLLQSVTRNALADTGLLGLHAGAQLALVTLLATTEALTATRLRLPVALGGALAAAALVWTTARRRGQAPRSGARDQLLLVGIALGAALHAVGLLVAFAAPADVLARAVVWTSGNLGAVRARDLALLGVVLVLVLGSALAIARSLDMLALGDEAARGLGVASGRLRLGATALAVLGAAVCVAVGGAIATLGFLAPNLARRVVGPRTAPLLVLSACTGAILLLAADLLGRTAFGDVEVPAGVLVGVVGAPCFLWLLVRR